MMSLPSRLLVMTFALAVPLGACGRPDPVSRGPAIGEGPATSESPATTGIPRELQTRMEAFQNAWNGSDPAAVAAFFAEDATMVVDGNRYTGRAQIERAWLVPNVPAISDLVMTTTETVENRDEQVVVRGRHTFNAGPPQQPAQRGSGRHELTWTRTGGIWQIRSSTVRSDG